MVVVKRSSARTSATTPHPGTRMRTSPVLLAGLIIIGAALTALGGAEAPPAVTGTPDLTPMDETRARDWLARWQAGITHDARNRYCDKELGEEIGWLITP